LVQSQDFTHGNTEHSRQQTVFTLANILVKYKS